MNNIVTRFLLRLLSFALDILVVEFVVYIGIKLSGHRLEDFSPNTSSLYILAAWFLILEPGMLAIFGTTPARKLLNISLVRVNGNKLSYWEALTRWRYASAHFENTTVLRILIALGIVLVVYVSGIISLHRDINKTAIFLKPAKFPGVVFPEQGYTFKDGKYQTGKGLSYYSFSQSEKK